MELQNKMSLIALAAITLISILFLLNFIKKGYGSKKLPGGSLGWPLIGETLSFLQAQRKDKGPEWINERVSKHGKVFKTSLMGSPTMIIVGQAGNKFILGSGDDVLAANQPKTLSTIAGKNNIFELTGPRHRLVREAMLSFLKPENLQHYTKHMDDLVTTLFLNETKEKDTIPTVVFMKKLTFTIACNILFGIRDEGTKEAFFHDFGLAFKAVWSIPVNFPGTVFSNGLKARARIIKRLLPILRKRQEDISKGITSPTSDVMSCLLALRDESGKPISEDEVLDNFFTLMIASHDTSAILLSLMVWKLSRDTDIFNQVLKEQMEIMGNKEAADARLTWGDIQKMKYTWRVGQEMMRMIPPVFGSFRKAVKDISFGGYDIPKGWQVFWASYGTHMDEDIFENPMEFDPSRFHNASKPIPPYAYIPFGGGLHSCIGNEFARVETLVSIHKLVTMFEWTPVHPDEAITRQPMPYPSKGLPIKVKPRKFLD